jgi:replicative DNA helicase
MNREEAKSYAKVNIVNYLLSKGINIEKQFNCLNPQHPDKTPSMSYNKQNHTVKCWSQCDTSYDIFDLVGLEYGLISDKDKFQKVYDMYNIEIDSNPINLSLADKATKSSAPTTSSINKHKNSNSTKTLPQDYSQFFLEAKKELNSPECIEYLNKRCISASTATQYNLGYQKNWHSSDKSPASPRLIIPTSKEGYAAIDIRENLSKSQEEYKKMKTGKGHLFNMAALTASKPCFIVEGEIDALSFIDNGFNAISLGGVKNINIFDEAIKDIELKARMIIALDNDGSGIDAAKKLAQLLTESGRDYFLTDNTLYDRNNDANDLLVKDGKESFCKKINLFLSDIENKISTEKEADNEEAEMERQKYQENSALYNIPLMKKYIELQKTKKHISTGFDNLDEVLGGSLFEGLYIIGAISSLGKTTWVVQVADALAQQGQDVLYFSLEMSKYELMAKSISRQSLLHCLDEDIKTNYAKTTRGILDGARYPKYSLKDHEVINAAINNYSKYASRLYIHEGVNQIGIKEIQEKVDEHVKYTNNTPIIIIDYLQILAPFEVRSSDKQNTDKAVLELKRISRQFQTPVIVVSSLNRQSYKSAITMEAFKESGAIEYSSDVLIGLQLKGAGSNNFDCDKAKKSDPRAIELKVLKNRNGETGKTLEFKYHTLFNEFRV